MFACRYCSFSSKIKFFKIQHEEVAHEGVVTRCPICDATVKYSNYLSEHIRSMHGTETFPCGECSYVGKTKILLNKHKRDHHKEKLYQCEFCDYKASTPSYLNKHFHYRSFLKIECDRCGKKLKGKSNLVRHQKGCYRYQCKKCPFKCNEKSDFEKHLESKRCENTSYIFCKVCNFKTTNKAKMNYHMKDKHSTLIFECDKCDFKSGYEAQMKYHKERSHTRYQCICNFVTEKMSTFDLHIKTKHGGSKFGSSANSEKCSVCKIVPKTKKAFQRHQFMKHKEGDFEDPVTIKQKEGFEKRNERIKLREKEINVGTTTEDINTEEDDKAVVTLPRKIFFEEVLKNESSGSNLVQDRLEEEKCDDISSDDDDEGEEDEDIGEEDKREMYLCPVGSCRFSLDTEDNTSQREHFRQSHPDKDHSGLRFFKL